MRNNVRAFVESAVEHLPLRGPVFEFGSYLVDGQAELANLRGLFPGQSYTGCDMRRGPGVDRVEDLAALTLADRSAQTVLCLDTLEHVFEIRRAIEEMIRILAPGGTLLIAVPMDFPVHAYPDDYWRLTPSCLMRLLEPLEGRVIGFQGVESHPHTVFAVGIKAPFPAGVSEGVGQFISSFQDWLAAAERDLSLGQQVKRWMNLLLRGKGQRRKERDYFKTQFVIDLNPRHATDELGQMLAGVAGGRSLGH